jgi:hypothetical protein
MCDPDKEFCVARVGGYHNLGFSSAYDQVSGFFAILFAQCLGTLK